MNAVTKPPRQPSPAPKPLDDRFETIVEAHQAAVWRYLRYLGARVGEADDLTQETFLALARSDFHHQNDAATAGYLRTVARNQLLMLRRKHRREKTLADAESAQLEAAEAVWRERSADPWDDQVAAVRDCVARLDGRARQAVDLHYRDAASREVIAERLGMKPDGVKTLLRRTRTLLRECVERTLRAS